MLFPEVEVTRSLDNLVKFNCVVREENTRIIDSDELVAEKIKELSDVSNYVEGEDYDDEFSENLSKDKVERLLVDREEALLSDANEQAEMILGNAQAEARMIVENARKEGESMKIQSYAKGEKKGYEEGFEKGLSQVEGQKKELALKKEQLEQQYQKQLNEMEPVLVDALIDIFESAFAIQFAEKRDFIMHMLQSALSKIENSKEYLLRVSRDDYPVLQEQKEKIRQELPKSATVEVVEDLTLSKNQCLIETDGGLFDCSLDTQLDSLIRDLRMLSSM